MESTNRETINTINNSEENQVYFLKDLYKRNKMNQSYNNFNNINNINNQYFEFQNKKRFNKFTNASSRKINISNNNDISIDKSIKVNKKKYNKTRGNSKNIHKISENSKKKISEQYFGNLENHVYYRKVIKKNNYSIQKARNKSIYSKHNYNFTNNEKEIVKLKKSKREEYQKSIDKINVRKNNYNYKRLKAQKLCAIIIHPTINSNDSEQKNEKVYKDNKLGLKRENTIKKKLNHDHIKKYKTKQLFLERKNDSKIVKNQSFWKEYQTKKNFQKFCNTHLLYDTLYKFLIKKLKIYYFNWFRKVYAYNNILTHQKSKTSSNFKNKDKTVFLYEGNDDFLLRITFIKNDKFILFECLNTKIINNMKEQYSNSYDIKDIFDLYEYPKKIEIINIFKSLIYDGGIKGEFDDNQKEFKLKIIYNKKTNIFILSKKICNDEKFIMINMKKKLRQENRYGIII